MNRLSGVALRDGDFDVRLIRQLELAQPLSGCLDRCRGGDHGWVLPLGATACGQLGKDLAIEAHIKHMGADNNLIEGQMR